MVAALTTALVLLVLAGMIAVRAIADLRKLRLQNEKLARDLRNQKHVATIASEQAQDLEKERAQLSTELSDALRREQDLQKRFDKHVETLRIATTSLDEERRLREKAGIRSAALQSKIIAAIETLQEE